MDVVLSVIPDQLYDTLQILPGEFTSASFFVGQQGARGKTLAETNLKTPAAFTGGHAFAVRSIEVTVRDVIFEETLHALSRLSMTFMVNDMPVPDPYPLDFFLRGRVRIEQGGFWKKRYQVLRFGPWAIYVGGDDPNFLVVLDPGDTFRVSLDATRGSFFKEAFSLRFRFWGSYSINPTAGEGSTSGPEGLTSEEGEK